MAGPWVALLCALALLLRPLPPQAAMAAAMAQADAAWFGGSICHVDGGTPEKAPASPMHDCELCPACHLAVVAGILPAPALVPAPPAVVLAVVSAPPEATGPPALWRGAAAPRGPPSFSV